MPAVVMKINDVKVLEVYLPCCRLFFVCVFVVVVVVFASALPLRKIQEQLCACLSAF